MTKFWFGDEGNKKELKKRFFVRSYIVIFHFIVIASLLLYQAPKKWLGYFGTFTLVWGVLAFLSYVDFKDKEEGI